MGSHARGADGAVRIVAGDTLLKIVAEWYPSHTPGDRLKLSRAFFRKVHPQPIRVADADTVHPGDVLYFRPDLAGLKKAGGGKAGGKTTTVTDGVKDAEWKPATRAEFKAAIGQADTFLASAITALHVIDKNNKVYEWFGDIFPPVGFRNTGATLGASTGGRERPARLRRAKTALTNFQAMRKELKTVTFGFQTTKVKTESGIPVRAYAVMDGNRIVAVKVKDDMNSWDRLSLASQGHTLIHELAHLAVAAGHGEDDSLNDAEAYAIFASMLKTRVKI